MRDETEWLLISLWEQEKHLLSYKILKHSQVLIIIGFCFNFYSEMKLVRTYKNIIFLFLGGGL